MGSGCHMHKNGKEIFQVTQHRTYQPFGDSRALLSLRQTLRSQVACSQKSGRSWEMTVTDLLS